MKYRKHRMFAVALALAAALLTGCTAPAAQPLPPMETDLTICTSQEESVYGPIVKEFEERTGRHVAVQTVDFRSLREGLEDGSLSERCDLIFGADAATLETYKALWQPHLWDGQKSLDERYYDPEGRWTGFSVLSPVILYNTRVVTYRELPEGWTSLLEPRWSGRVAFADPQISQEYAAALTALSLACEDPDAAPGSLAASLNGLVLADAEAVHSAVASGRCSIGVTLEEAAEQLCRQNLDIDYLYPAEGSLLLPDGSAILKGCAHPETAAEFLEFTVSKDTQRILVSHLGRRSVRTDVPIPAGLASLRQLPLKTIDYGEAAARRDHALALWEDSLAVQKGGTPR